jgi:hypothetical protein
MPAFACAKARSLLLFLDAHDAVLKDQGGACPVCRAQALPGRHSGVPGPLLLPLLCHQAGSRGELDSADREDADTRIRDGLQGWGQCSRAGFSTSLVCNQAGGRGKFRSVAGLQGGSVLGPSFLPVLCHYPGGCGERGDCPVTSHAKRTERQCLHSR